MRIIGGKYKHRRFDVPHTFKARPTTDFAKEGLFNILHNNYVDFDSAPSALDLFAGTGSIGVEFVSRGCGKVVSVEKDFSHCKFLYKVAKELNDRAWIPVNSDVFKFVQRCSDKFDVIFADPPYALENLADIPRLVFEADILADDGVFVLEHGKTNDFSKFPYFVAMRKYGAVHFSFFQKIEDEDAEA